MELKGLFVGLTTIDIQYLVDTFPALNSKTVAGTFAMSVGGPATNAAITFAHLGGKSHLMSAIGNNQFTPFIESELHHYNVEFTDLSPLANQLPTVSSIVTTRGGYRTVITTASLLTSNASDMTCIVHQDDYGVVLVDGFNMKPGALELRKPNSAEYPSCSMVGVGRTGWRDCSPLLTSRFVPSIFFRQMEATKIVLWSISLARV